MDFATIMGMGADAVAGGWNGATGNVNLSTIEDYIDVHEKVVLTANGQVDLEASVAHKLMYATANPAPGSTPNAAQVEAVSTDVANLIAHYEMYALLVASGWHPEWRSSDVIADVAYGAAGVARETVQLARNLIHAFTTSEEGRKLLAGVSGFVAHGMVFNAVHRKRDANHNGRPNMVTRPGSATYRASCVYGAKRDDAVTFLRSYAHVNNHHLTTPSLDDAVDRITGVSGASLSEGTVYGGNDVGGMPIHAVLSLSDAATDRWPVSAMGAAAIHLGLRYLSKALTMIASRFTDPAYAQATEAVESLRRRVIAYAPNREAIAYLYTVITEMITIGVGICSWSKREASKVRENESISSLCDRNSTAYDKGIELGKFINDHEMDQDAMADLLAAFAQLIVDSIENIYELHGDEGPIDLSGPGGGGPRQARGGGSGGGGSAAPVRRAARSVAKTAVQRPAAPRARRVSPPTTAPVTKEVEQKKGETEGSGNEVTANPAVAAPETGGGVSALDELTAKLAALESQKPIASRSLLPNKTSKAEAARQKAIADIKAQIAAVGAPAV